MLVITSVKGNHRQRTSYELEGSRLVFGPARLRLHCLRKGAKLTPALKLLIKKARAEEVSQALDVIGAASMRYFRTVHYRRYKLAVPQKDKRLPKRFPFGFNSWTPSKPCCQYPSKLCPVMVHGWNGAWSALGFNPYKPHPYQARYKSSGTGRSAIFKLELRADLDCDGKYSSYVLVGRVNAKLEVQLKRKVLRPLE